MAKAYPVRPRQRKQNTADIRRVVKLSQGIVDMKLLAEAHKPSLGPPLDRHPGLTQPGFACLHALAARYVWWKTPEEAMLYPDRVAAQVMNLGDWNDVIQMVESTGEDYLRQVLTTSEAGQLNPRSWHYWHYRLGLAEFGRIPVPPMPVRKIA